MPGFPIGLDYSWFAVDESGHVARFTNGGKGPMTIAVLADRELADRAEILADALPALGGYQAFIEYPDGEDFIAIARRGFFAYDWADATRVAAFTNRYEIAMRPTQPLKVGDLPAELRQLASLVRPDGIRFRFKDSLAIDKMLGCPSANSGPEPSR